MKLTVKYLLMRKSMKIPYLSLIHIWSEAPAPEYGFQVRLTKDTEGNITDARIKPGAGASDPVAVVICCPMVGDSGLGS